MNIELSTVTTLSLTPVEARVIGALIEKSATTPEYYPLTLNALLAACNQKNNRAPVFSLDEKTLAQTIPDLQEKHVLETFSGATARVLKYRERLTERLALTPAERAVICELLLRGPQTAGELRSRAGRMHPFTTLEEVQSTLAGLAGRAAGALVMELPRQPGQKETRVAHLLGDQPPESEVPRNAVPQSVTAMAVSEGSSAVTLESRVAALEAEVAAMRQQWIDFKTQFE